MTHIYSPLHLEDLDNCRFSRLLTVFDFESDVLKRLGLPSRCRIPVSFVQDLESVPWFRGTNNRAGLIHDYLCRIDSIPVVTRSVAAAVYYEFLRHCYGEDPRNSKWLWATKKYLRSWIKWGVVYVAPGYFHKHLVLATPEEMARISPGAFVDAEEQLDALITKQESVTAGAKDLPPSVDDRADLIDASKKVVEDLKEAKSEVKEP
jgi:hypothetical protein